VVTQPAPRTITNHIAITIQEEEVVAVVVTKSNVTMRHITHGQDSMEETPHPTEGLEAHQSVSTPQVTMGRMMLYWYNGWLYFALLSTN
jgi:hypothetical protein